MVVRVAVIGAGAMGREHIRNLALMRDAASLVAVADDFKGSRDQVRALLQSLGMTKTAIHEKYEAVLVDGIDAVIIATPNFHHHEVIKAAIKAKKAILVEKPLCTTLNDCQDIQRLVASDPDLFVWVGMEYRYIPSVARLIAEVNKGTVGRLQMLAIREHRFPFLTKVRNWNRFNAKTGGTLVEKCCHFFDLMLHIIKAPPVRVFATGGQDVNHVGEKDEDGNAADILDNAYVCWAQYKKHK